MKQEIYVLSAILASIHVLNEDLGLFAGSDRPGEFDARTQRARGPATDWCFDMLDVAGWEVGELEDLTDAISADVLERARGLLVTLGPNGAEAFYLSACVLSIDEFCARAEGSAIECAGSPIEALRNRLVDSLRHDHGVDLSSAMASHDAILTPARELVRAWRVRKSSPL